MEPLLMLTYSQHIWFHSMPRVTKSAVKKLFFNTFSVFTIHNQSIMQWCGNYGLRYSTPSRIIPYTKYDHLWQLCLCDRWCLEGRWHFHLVALSRCKHDLSKSGERHSERGCVSNNQAAQHTFGVLSCADILLIIWLMVSESHCK